MASSANNNRRSSGTPRPRQSGQSRGQRRETPIEEALREEKEREMKVEVGTIIFIALMLLLFLCNFHIIGAFGDAVSGFMFGVFGLPNYAITVLLTVGMFFFRANRGNKTAMKKLAAAGLLYVFIGMICDMASKTAVSMESYSFTELFRLGKEGRCGGGLISGSLAFMIKSFLGNVGLVLIIIFGIIICLVLLTEKSFINFVKNKGIEFAERSREYTLERKERQLIEKQQQSELLEDKRRKEARTVSAENDRALNVRDKLKAEASINLTDTEEELPGSVPVVPVPVPPPVSEQPHTAENTGYKPNIRESLKEKFQASKEKREEDRRLHREAKENDSILRVADGNQNGCAPYGYESTQEMHEISDPGQYYGNDRYSDDYGDGYQEGYRDQYPDNNGGQYTDNRAYAEDETILKYKINNGETLLDIYGRPVFDYEKQPVRSKHSVVVTDEFSAIDGNTDYDDSEVYSSDDDILSNDDVDIMAEYESATRKNYEAGGENSSDISEHDVRKVITPVAPVRPVAVPPAPDKDLDDKDSFDQGYMRKSSDSVRPEGKTTGDHLNNSAPVRKETYDKQYKFPPIKLLKESKNSGRKNSVELEQTKISLQETLNSFGVKVDITEAVQGPAVTRYEMTLEPGTKVSKILGLSDDIKLALASSDIRIEAPIPGKSAVGIEVPNKETSMVSLRELFESREFKEAKSTLSFAVGKNIGGDVIVSDIGKMPHVLIAGATGSGKSVCINTLIMSIIYKASPEDVQMIMVDPKVVELSVYNGIPHLMLPVVTDPKKAAASLAWGVKEMDIRYKKFADLGVRDLAGYNEKVAGISDSERTEYAASGFDHFKLPKIVIIIDELADLMMVCGKEVEEAICRLAQLARACGIHLVVATQRPSVDVITGLIKANMPSRMAFAVSSGVDSRTILDTVGAEKLLGKGDMLFYPQGKTKPERVQGAFVSDSEVADVVEFLKNQKLRNEFTDRSGINPETLDKFSDSKDGGKASSAGAAEETDGRDELFAEAGRCIINSGKCSIGYLQRMLKIGFNRAARIMDSLSEEGVVGPESGTKAREILMTIEEFESYLDS